MGNQKLKKNRFTRLVPVLNRLGYRQYAQYLQINESSLVTHQLIFVLLRSTDDESSMLDGKPMILHRQCSPNA